MANAFCLVKEYADNFVQGLKDGSINTTKLSTMSPEERHNYLAKFVGEENAHDVNSLFESKLLLKNQQAGLERWKDKVGGISGQTRKDLATKIASMDKVLDPKGNDPFFNDLAQTKLGVGVTQEEAKTIYDLANKAQDAKDNSSGALAGVSDEYLKAKTDLNNYINSVKPTSTLGSIGRNLSTIGRNNLLMNPATPLKTALSQLTNTVVDSVTRRLSYMSLNGENGDLVKSARKEAWQTFKKTGMNTAAMEGLDDTHVMGKGENFQPAKGVDNAASMVGKAASKVVGKVAQVSNKVAIDWEHNIAFNFTYQHNFYDMANLVSSDIAHQEGVGSGMVKSRAAEIFKDAAKIEPDTKEGKMVRMLAQKQAARVTSTNETWASRFSVGVKDTLNKVIPGFRLGDVISPIAKIPANVIANGLENSGVGIPKAVGDILAGRTKLQSEDLNTKYEGMAQFRQGMQTLLRTAGTLGVAAAIAQNLSKDDFRTDNYGNHFFRIGNTWINTEYISSISPALAGMMQVKQDGKPGQNTTDTAAQFLGGSAQGLKLLPGANEVTNLVNSITNGNYSKGIQKYASDFFTSRGEPTFIKSLQSGNPVNNLFFGKTGVESNDQVKTDAANAKAKANPNDWNQTPSQSQQGFLNAVGQDKFDQANKQFNQQYDQWKKSMVNNDKYNSLSPNGQKAADSQMSQKIQNQVFQQYGYKAPKPTSNPQQQQTIKEIKQTSSVQEIQDIAQQIIDKIIPPAYASNGQDNKSAFGIAGDILGYSTTSYENGQKLETEHPGIIQNVAKGIGDNLNVIKENAGDLYNVIFNNHKEAAPINGKSDSSNEQPVQAPASDSIGSKASVNPAPSTDLKVDFTKFPNDQNGAKRKGFVPSQPPSDIAALIKKYFPDNYSQAVLVANTENAQYDSKRADNVNSADGSRDRGIFQINSNTFNGLMQRAGNELKAAGINSFDDMYDPEKNIFVARLIQQGAKAYKPDTNPNGWSGWYGWQDTGYNLNNGWYSAPDRGAYETSKKQASS
jgi:hypothetical protein